jgi:hypothetical protein
MVGEFRSNGLDMRIIELVWIMVSGFPQTKMDQ